MEYEGPLVNFISHLATAYKLGKDDLKSRSTYHERLQWRVYALNVGASHSRIMPVNHFLLHLWTRVKGVFGHFHFADLERTSMVPTLATIPRLPTIYCDACIQYSSSQRIIS